MIKTSILPGLNGIRALAAISVVIHHIEGFKAKGMLPNLTHIDFIQAIGPQGVKAFFVLSGFLITHLLLIEKNGTGLIAIKSFYVRRILRIWPLYFMVIMISLISYYFNLSPSYFTQSFDTYFTAKLFLLIFLLPNLLLYVFGSIYGVGVLWSIGAEEQFYLFWPHLINKNKNLLKKFLLVIIIMVFLRCFCQWGLNHFNVSSILGKLLRAGYYIFIFDSMVIGGIGALLLHKKSDLLNLLYSPKIQLATLGILLLLLLTNFSMPVIDNSLWSFAFAIIILNVATNKNSIITLNGKTLNWLGKISYGIYMYHSFAISIMIYFLSKAFNPNGGLFHFSLYLGSFIITICAAQLSFKYFEKPILRYKNKFTIVHVNP